MGLKGVTISWPWGLFAYHEMEPAVSSKIIHQIRGFFRLPKSQVTASGSLQQTSSAVRLAKLFLTQSWVNGMCISHHARHTQKDAVQSTKWPDAVPYEEGRQNWPTILVLFDPCKQE